MINSLTLKKENPSADGRVERVAGPGADKMKRVNLHYVSGNEELLLSVVPFYCCHLSEGILVTLTKELL